MRTRTKKEWTVPSRQVFIFPVGLEFEMEDWRKTLTKLDLRIDCCPRSSSSRYLKYYRNQPWSKSCEAQVSLLLLPDHRYGAQEMALGVSWCCCSQLFFCPLLLSKIGDGLDAERSGSLPAV